MQKEIWKDVKGYEGIYKISDLGNIKSLKFNKEKTLKPTEFKNGYLRICLSKNGCKKLISIHQLVAVAFLNHEICGHKKVVNHINFNKKDNRVYNLEVVTQRENANHKHIKSSSKYIGVHWRKDSKKWRAVIFADGKKKYLGHFKSEYKAHLAYQKELKIINDGEKMP